MLAQEIVAQGGKGNKIDWYIPFLWRSEVSREEHRSDDPTKGTYYGWSSDSRNVLSCWKVEAESS